MARETVDQATERRILAKERRRRARRINERYEVIREKNWPDIGTRDLWHRRRKAGFATIPRTLPIIMSIMDDMSDKPVSRAYLTLWARITDESVIIIKEPRAFAFETGYKGPNAEVTWKTRMKKLVELGFILANEGPSGPYHYVLVLNPYSVIKKLRDEGKVKEDRYGYLLERASEIGAEEDLISDDDDE